MLSIDHDPTDPHTDLTIALGALANSTELLSFIALDSTDYLHRRSKIIGEVFLGLTLSIFLFICFEGVSFDASLINGINYALLISAIFTFLVRLSLGVGIWVDRFRWYARKNNELWIIVGGVSILATIAYPVYAIALLKYGQTDCNMNTGEENAWTFGQVLSVAMLGTILLSFIEAVLSK